MRTVLITGANRGIGLEFCKQYAEQGWRVLACCRLPDQAHELNSLAASHDDVQVYALDVQDRHAIDQCAEQLKGVTLDVLIANAGVYGDKRGCDFGNLDYQAWQETIATNVFGVVKVSEAFLPHLNRSASPLIAALSSQMGSIADNGSGGSLLYRSSKAALNAVMKSLAIDLKQQKIGVLIFHPGWVQTDMGGENALINAKTSVSGMMQQIKQFNLSHSGQFTKYDGTLLPW